jgi:hypothetical protein
MEKKEANVQVQVHTGKWGYETLLFTTNDYARTLYMVLKSSRPNEKFRILDKKLNVIFKDELEPANG